MTDSVKRKCPKCGKNKLRRLIGAGAAIMFKGSGFYKTDYRSDSYKKHAEADKAPVAESKSDGKAETKTETKSESKAESTAGASKAESKKSGGKDKKK
jgi:hypothetical protein